MIRIVAPARDGFWTCPCPKAPSPASRVLFSAYFFWPKAFILSRRPLFLAEGVFCYFHFSFSCFHFSVLLDVFVVAWLVNDCWMILLIVVFCAKRNSKQNTIHNALNCVQFNSIYHTHLFHLLYLFQFKIQNLNLFFS